MHCMSVLLTANVSAAAAVVATFYVKIVIVVTKLTHIQWEAG